MNTERLKLLVDPLFLFFSGTVPSSMRSKGAWDGERFTRLEPSPWVVHSRCCVSVQEEGGYERRERGLLKIGLDYTITRISAAVVRVHDRGTEVSFVISQISFFLHSSKFSELSLSSQSIFSRRNYIVRERKSDCIPNREIYRF